MNATSNSVVFGGIFWVCATCPADAAVRVISPQQATPAIAFGVGELIKAVEGNGDAVTRVSEVGPADRNSILVTLSSDETSLKAFGLAGATAAEKPESFSIVPRNKGGVAVIGRDATGAMYGALDLAEQIADGGSRPDLAQTTARRCSPFIPLRGTNLFLHTQALDDPKSWYFDEAFWQGYIDTLARTRHNFLDIHATYDLNSTEFPNVYPYFFRFPDYPDVGVPEEQAQRNLLQFKKIVALAGDRGIKVGLMSYSARWNIADQQFKDPGDKVLADYTARCVQTLMREVPDLYVIGFRIGETGKDPSFFQDSYIRGLKLARRTDMPLYTRSWVTSHPGIEAIARSYPGRMFNEIKFNGEQLGLPYQVTGGWMAHQGSYAYQWYSDVPSKLETIWQIRANGTHRVFPWGDPVFVARTVRACTFMNALGYTVEPMSSYYPWTDFYTNTASQPQNYWRWMWQRDWFWYALWGRLGYDPDIAEQTWVRMFEKRFGKPAGRAVYELFTESSRQVPLIYAYRNGGPDHRSIAPECETGGTLEQFLRPVPPSHMKATPFDASCYMSIAEYADLLAAGGRTGRITPLEVATTLEEHGRRGLKAAEVARTAGVSGESAGEFETMVVHAREINELSLYYANKIRAAIDLGVHERSGRPESLADLVKHVDAYMAAWARLVSITETTHRPFPEPLACKTQSFHWRTEGEKLAEDTRFLKEYVAKARSAAPKASKSETPPLAVRGDDRTPPSIQPLPATVDRKAGKATLSARITDTGGIASAVLRWKPTPSVYLWTDVQLTEGKDGLYTADVPMTYEGLQYLYEAVDVCGNGAMAPDTRRETPYIVVPGWERPPDKIYFGPQTHSQDGITVTCNHRFRFDRLVRETTTHWDREHTLDRYPAELEGLPRIRYTRDELQFAPAWFEFEVTVPTRIYATIEGPVLAGWQNAPSMTIKVRQNQYPVWYRDISPGKTRVTTTDKTRLVFVAFDRQSPKGGK